MSSRRTKRIAEAIKKEVSSIVLNDLNDPRISFVTVTKVEISSDLKKAKIFVSILGNETTQETSLYGIKRARSFIQAKAARSLNIKYTPILSFHIDDSLKKIAHINNLLASVSTETEEENTEDEDEDEHVYEYDDEYDGEL